MSPFNHKKELQKIIDRYVAGTATDDEIRFLEKYYQYLDKNENVLDGTETAELEKMAETNFTAIQVKINATRKRKTVRLYKYISAAAILLLISGTTFVFLNKKSTTLAERVLATNKNLDILPGTDKAILTLANGTKVVLDKKTATNISDSAGLKISKTKDGQIVYTVLGQENFNRSEVAYNTIETPKGGQYQIILPDGTKVWLNAASALKYPEVFVGNERNVELTGEAYFEVAKNKAKPFHVKSHGQDVEVLGTHFNINSYMDDRTIKTTLLEGMVRVSNGKSAKILKPGEQAIANVAGDGTIRLASDVDTDDETAWKNGLFQFNNAGLKTILNQLERWYDINIDYSSVPDKKYNGMVPRKAKLSEVLKMLEKTGNIRFEIVEGRNLKVLQEK